MNYSQNNLWNLEKFVLVNNKLCGKLMSSLVLSIIFAESFKVTSVPFMFPDFNLLSKLNSLKCYIEAF